MFQVHGGRSARRLFGFRPATQSERKFEVVMQSYPAVDPIPLPAPLWLLKLLHIVTLSLHFVAVEMLLGGLLLAVLLSLFRARRWPR